MPRPRGQYPERMEVIDALNTGGNKAQAAQLLGLNPVQFGRIYDYYEIKEKKVWL